MTDRQLTIKVATERNSTSWKVVNTTVTAFCDRLHQTVHTPEKAASYAKMSKEDKTATKDVGGFTSGLFEGTRRLRAKMQNLEFLKYDIDSATQEQLETVRNCGVKGFWYTTHSSTPEDLRIRVLIFTNRRMTLDEGEYLERVFADRNLGGVDAVDKCSYEPHQMMFWPSTPSDLEYECGRISGELLDVDEWLSMSKDWTDRANWPVIPGEDDARKEYKKLGDPREKEGVIGAFCSVRSISEAIEKDIPDVYEPYKGDSRYTYLNGSSAGGALVYDDLWLYSMHATDPANNGHCVNAFDLVRIHKFGKLDKSTEYKDEEKRKSFDAMVKYALSIPEVAEQIDSTRYRKARAEEDFAEDLGDVSGMGDEESYKKLCATLERTKKGEIEPTMDNLHRIMSGDTRLANFGKNVMAEMVEVTGALPWKRATTSTFWTDEDMSGLRIYISRRFTDFSKQNYEDVFNVVTTERSFHPLKDVLDGLVWDGKERIDELLIKYLGAEDNSYTRAVSRKFMLGAIARIYDPGCKFEYALVLCGDQGVGKSTFVEKLSLGYSTDNLSVSDMTSKEGAERIRGSWIVEIPEMVGMKKTESEAVKAFISRRVDKFRPAYGRFLTEYKRQCVFICTTNMFEGYLRDETGNRRFWPVDVSSADREFAPWDLSRKEVEQMWAEAKNAYEVGDEELFLTGDEAEIAVVVQRDAMESDPRSWRLRKYLDMELPENWYKWPVDKRVQYFQTLIDNDSPDDDFVAGNAGSKPRDRVCIAEIVNECFGTPGGKQPTIEARDARRIIATFADWSRAPRGNVMPPYGKQRYYKRIEN